MKQYGAFEVKTHFSEILGEVIKGEKYVITKHGVKVAMLIPFEEKNTTLDPVEEAIRAIKSLRNGITLGKGLSIKDLIEEGRR